MTDLSQTITPKSDQLNADDLIAGPRTITITRVTKTVGEQPVSIYFEGDDGKPYKPCKSMLRVLIIAWGADATKFAGRKLTLYRDPEVIFGKDKVGGIRISHMSHIDGARQFALTVTRGRRKPYAVQPLRSGGAGESAGGGAHDAPGGRGASQPADDFPGDLAPPGGEHRFVIINSKGERRETPDGEAWASTLETMFAKASAPNALWDDHKAHVADAEVAGFSQLAQRVWAAAGKRGVDVQ